MDQDREVTKLNYNSNVGGKTCILRRVAIVAPSDGLALNYDPKFPRPRHTSAAAGLCSPFSTATSSAIVLWEAGRRQGGGGGGSVVWGGGAADSARGDNDMGISCLDSSLGDGRLSVLPSQDLDYHSKILRKV